MAAATRMRTGIIGLLMSAFRYSKTILSISMACVPPGSTGSGQPRSSRPAVVCATSLAGSGGGGHPLRSSICRTPGSSGHLSSASGMPSSSLSGAGACSSVLGVRRSALRLGRRRRNVFVLRGQRRFGRFDRLLGLGEGNFRRDGQGRQEPVVGIAHTVGKTDRAGAAENEKAQAILGAEQPFLVGSGARKGLGLIVRNGGTEELGPHLKAAEPEAEPAPKKRSLPKRPRFGSLSDCL